MVIIFYSESLYQTEAHGDDNDDEGDIESDNCH